MLDAMQIMNARTFLLIRILVWIRIVDVVVIAVVKVLFGIVIIVRLFRVRRRSRPVILFVHRIRLGIIILFLFFVHVLIELFLGTGFGLVDPILLKLDEAVNMRNRVDFGYAERSALLGQDSIACRAAENWV